ncbi:hypothetical protein [Mycobacterium sp. IS-1556]|uniref:hypothetical protein n=1 Tax=Mycobacterium sp. IS-1556 TaxID=1772276 RepID=UPI002570F796|nr:hypothetical protein [Mycobacterium sp. IS-1556]
MVWRSGRRIYRRRVSQAAPLYYAQAVTQLVMPLKCPPAFLECGGMQRNVLIRTFAALRFITGIAAWLAPSTTGRLMGLSSGRDQPFTTQLFGSRELTLAVAITDAASPRLQKRALQLGLLTDVLDVIAAVRGVRARTLSTTGAVVAGGGAALFAGLGVASLNARDHSAVR